MAKKYAQKKRDLMAKAGMRLNVTKGAQEAMSSIPKSLRRDKK